MTNIIKAVVLHASFEKAARRLKNDARRKLTKWIRLLMLWLLKRGLLRLLRRHVHDKHRLRSATNRLYIAITILRDHKRARLLNKHCLLLLWLLLLLRIVIETRIKVATTAGH